MKNYLFKLENVTYKNIFKNINVEIYANTVIKGESGSGKSTLLKLLNGTIVPENGKITYNNAEISKNIRDEVLLVSQNVFLYDATILENFDKFYEKTNKTKHTNQEIIKILEVCKINMPLQTNTKYMSGGEKLRLYIAIFLSFMPKILMLDEPTSALDDKSSQDVINNIKIFCENKNIKLIIISHGKIEMKNTIYLEKRIIDGR